MSGHEDVVVPWRESNTVAVDLITQHIRTKLGHFFRCVCLKWATGCCWSRQAVEKRCLQEDVNSSGTMHFHLTHVLLLPPMKICEDLWRSVKVCMSFSAFSQTSTSCPRPCRLVGCIQRSDHEILLDRTDALRAPWTSEDLWFFQFFSMSWYKWVQRVTNSYCNQPNRNGQMAGVCLLCGPDHSPCGWSSLGTFALPRDWSDNTGGRAIPRRGGQSSADIWSTWRFPKSWGYPNLYMVYNGKSQSKT